MPAEKHKSLALVNSLVSREKAQSAPNRNPVKYEPAGAWKDSSSSSIRQHSTSSLTNSKVSSYSQRSQGPISSTALNNRSEVHRASISVQVKCTDKIVTTQNVLPQYRPHTRDELREGVVFSAPQHVQEENPGRTDCPSNLSQSAFGPVYSKYRKFIVITSFTYHALALPIYTFKGKGLASKSNKDELISIRTIGASKLAAPGESQHDFLWACQGYRSGNPEDDKWRSMTDTTAVDFTRPYCHDFLKKCELTGEVLDQDSIDKLRALFQTAILYNMEKMVGKKSAWKEDRSSAQSLQKVDDRAAALKSTWIEDFREQVLPNRRAMQDVYRPKR